MLIHLNLDEIDELFKQDPTTEHDGGYQNLLIKLQRKINRSSGELILSASDLKKNSTLCF